MLLFAHAGIPLGVAWLSCRAISRARLRPSVVGNSAHCTTDDRSPARPWITSLDYRFLLLGSILPDIIDKPLGTWLLRDALGNSRAFGHTLLLTAVLMIAALYLYARRRDLSLLSLSFGFVAHLCLDEMWLCPRTLLWPLHGWSFDKMDVGNWLEMVLTSLRTEPSIYVPEIIGGLLLGAFFFDLIRQGKLHRFLRSGVAH